MGLAHKREQTLGDLKIVARKDFSLLDGFERIEDDACCGFSLEGHAKGEWHTCAASIKIDDDGIEVNGSIPGLRDFKTLLIPYLRDPGTGLTTEVLIDKTIRLILGDEEIEIAPAQEIFRAIHLPYGYENRRGLCGLVRLDFKGMMEGISYRVRVVR